MLTSTGSWLSDIFAKLGCSQTKTYGSYSAKKISSQQNKPLEVSTHSTDTTGEQTQTASVLNKENEPTNNSVFKAVGVIQGEVNFGEDGTNTITINGITYRLKYASEKRRTLDALKLEIKNTGKNVQRLIVYPRVIHFPRIDQPHTVYFELVGFESSSVQDKGIINELNELEFKLNGLWQFIPVCRVPCVSIFKNFNEERKLFIKQLEPFVKVRFTLICSSPTTLVGLASQAISVQPQTR